MYNVNDGRFVFKDKYYGRSIPTEQFPHALGDFFDNGEQMLIHHIPRIMQKLCALAAIVRTLPRWRFYAASLLFLYDGDAEAQARYADRFWRHWMAGEDLPPLQRNHLEPGELNIRLVDFANCTTGDDFLPPLKAGEVDEKRPSNADDLRRATFPPVHADEPDVGFLLGLQSICYALKALWSEERHRRLAIDPTDDIRHLSIPDKKVFDCSLVKENAAKLAASKNAAAATPFPTLSTITSPTHGPAPTTSALAPPQVALPQDLPT